MAEYIDKDALVAEIKRRIESCAKQREDMLNVQCHTLADDASARMGELNCIQDFLDTLEVKEVDLNEEIEKCLKRHSMLAVGKKDFTDIAKHFFELGLKVKQESNDEVKICEAQIYLEDDGGEPPYDGKQWLDLSCTEYEIPKTLFKDGDNVEILIRKAQKGV